MGDKVILKPPYETGGCLQPGQEGTVVQGRCNPVRINNSMQRIQNYVMFQKLDCEIIIAELRWSRSAAVQSGPRWSHLLVNNSHFKFYLLESLIRYRERELMAAPRESSSSATSAEVRLIYASSSSSFLSYLFGLLWLLRMLLSSVGVTQVIRFVRAHVTWVLNGFRRFMAQHSGSLT